MKECPNCHKKYDDSMNFCTDCGVALNRVYNQNSVSNTNTSHVRRTNNTSVEKTKKKWLSKENCHWYRCIGFSLCRIGALYQ